MRKCFLMSAFMLIFLTGCTSAGSEIVITDNAAVEACVDTEPVEADEQVSEDAQIQPVENVVVYVCGAVENPGVYELPGMSRIDDAVRAAGGFSEEADRTYVNLAARLSDGSKLQIPTVMETADEAVAKGIDSFDVNASSSDIAGSEGDKLININTASKEQLVTLPGIGDAVAGKIIKYREENGSFKSIEDIMKVSGIKDKLFSKIKDRITV